MHIPAFFANTIFDGKYTGVELEVTPVPMPNTKVKVQLCQWF